MDGPGVDRGPWTSRLRITCSYLDPAKDVFFSGGGNFQAKLKRTTQQAVLVLMFVASALFFCHFGVMFSIADLLHFSASCFLARRKKKTSFQGPGMDR